MRHQWSTHVDRHATCFHAVDAVRMLGRDGTPRAGDPEMAAMVREEVESLTRRVDGLAERLKVLLLPRDPLDDRNIMLEIRAGTGGEEAALWAADLVRMCAPCAHTLVLPWSDFWEARFQAACEPS